MPPGQSLFDRLGFFERDLDVRTAVAFDARAIAAGFASVFAADVVEDFEFGNVMLYQLSYARAFMNCSCSSVDVKAVVSLRL